MSTTRSMASCRLWRNRTKHVLAEGRSLFRPVHIRVLMRDRHKNIPSAMTLRRESRVGDTRVLNIENQFLKRQRKVQDFKLCRFGDADDPVHGSGLPLASKNSRLYRRQVRMPSFSEINFRSKDCHSIKTGLFWHRKMFPHCIHRNDGVLSWLVHRTPRSIIMRHVPKR